MLIFVTESGGNFVVLDVFIQVSYSLEDFNDCRYLLQGIVLGNYVPDVKTLKSYHDLSSAIEAHKMFTRELEAVNEVAIESAKTITFEAI